MAEAELKPWQTGNDSARWHGYFQPGSDGRVVANKLGITSDKAKLESAEAEHVEFRRVERLQAPRSNTFDLNHLRGINHQLFQDVYPFAGDLRTVDISRAGDSFHPYEDIEAGFGPLEERLANGLRGLSREEFVDAAAGVYAEINGLHPFREGNGRTIREFLDDLAEDAGYFIDWEAVHREQNLAARDAGRVKWTPDYTQRKANWEIPLKKVADGDLGPLKTMFGEIVQPVADRSATDENLQRRIQAPPPRASEWTPRRNGELPGHTR